MSQLVEEVLEFLLRVVLEMRSGGGSLVFIGNNYNCGNSTLLKGGDPFAEPTCRVVSLVK